MQSVVAAIWASKSYAWHFSKLMVLLTFFENTSIDSAG
jgi:hypothetical protein